jgi:hypothetical protein
LSPGQARVDLHSIVRNPRFPREFRHANNDTSLPKRAPIGVVPCPTWHDLEIVLARKSNRTHNVLDGPRLENGEGFMIHEVAKVLRSYPQCGRVHPEHPVERGRTQAVVRRLDPFDTREASRFSHEWKILGPGERMPSGSNCSLALANCSQLSP